MTDWLTPEQTALGPGAEAAAVTDAPTGNGGATVTTDILADLEAEVRPRGLPCRIAVMRRDRPDLAEQWDRVVAAKRAGASRASAAAIAGWFTKHGFELTRGVIEGHVRTNPTCAWCVRGISA